MKKRAYTLLFGLMLFCFMPLFGETGSWWVLPDGSPFEMIQIPAGSFEMGAKTSSRGTPEDEKPRHKIVLSASFWMSKTEVTQQQFESVMGYNPSKNQTLTNSSLPVESVSWFMALEFCRRLTSWSKKEGNLSDGHKFTLPTEAQWEYACKRQKNNEESSAENFGPEETQMFWTKENSGGTSRQVGLFPQNFSGLQDMQGNVWEWCLDWKGGYPKESEIDPLGPSSGIFRVIRGGCFMLGVEHSRPTNRSAAPPAARWPNVGFRIVLVPD